MKTSRRTFLSQAALGGLSTLLLSRRSQAAAAPSPENFRPLFDGRTLKGWHAVPRLGVPKSIDVALTPPEQLEQQVREWYARNAKTDTQKAKLAHVGHWEVQDGVLIGGQEPAGSGLGAYLMTDDKFGDFELELDARPDWPVDTGILIRQHALGSLGFQVNTDHRPDGAIGGVFGNWVSSFRAAPFSVTGEELPGFQVGNLREGGAEPQFPVPKMNYAATFADFKKTWRTNDWNRFRIRCVGELPLITTWINGAEICELDTSIINTPGFDPAVVRRVLGRTGHIGFEVHDNGGMGHARWAPGAVCRWRNIQIRTL